MLDIVYFIVEKKCNSRIVTWHLGADIEVHTKASNSSEGVKKIMSNESDVYEISSVRPLPADL